MSFTVAYLKNSFSQSAMENIGIPNGKHFMLEAGLNDVGMIVLPYLLSDILLKNGVDYGSMKIISQLVSIKT